MSNKLASRQRNEALIERDIAIYKSAMRGVAVRAIGEEHGLRSTQTVHRAIQRGREHVKTRGIDVEETRLTIHQLFDETLGHLAKTIRDQSERGCIEEFVDEQGNRSIRRRRGVDPRIAGELSRSLNRWAEFVKLLDRAPEVSANTTLINLQAPMDGRPSQSNGHRPSKPPRHESGHALPASSSDPSPARNNLPITLQQMRRLEQDQSQPAAPAAPAAPPEIREPTLTQRLI